MEIVHIALPSDQNYSIGLEVTAGSIAYHASHDVRLMIHVLDGGIEDSTLADIISKVERLHPHVEFNRIAVDEKLFKNFPVWSGNKMTYARLLLSEALPAVSHIIYSDTDFLWLIDIAKLWKERTAQDIIIGVRDHIHTIAREREWAEDHKMQFDSNNYFGAGLSFYNLDLFRKENIPTKVAEFLHIYPDVPFADQTALNHLLNGRIKFVGRQWQTLSIDITSEDIAHPLTIHYGGDIPWRRDKFWTFPLSDSALLWYAMYDYIEGVKPGTGVRSHLTYRQRIYKRALANIYHNYVLRAMFNILLKITGRGSYIGNLNKFARNLNLSQRTAIIRALQKN